MIRRAAAAAALLLLAAAHAVAAQDLPADTGFVDLIIQFGIERGPSRTVAALGRDSVVYVPLRELLAMAEVRVTEAAPGRRIAGVLEPDAVPFWFDTERGSRGRAGRTAALAPHDAAWRQEELYVAAPLAGELLDVGLRMDWAELSLVVVDAADLPVRRRLEREARRATALAAAARAALPAPELARSPEPLADGAVVDYALTLPSPRPEDAASLSGGLGVALAGGNLAYQGTLQRVPGGTEASGRVSWTRAWPERRVVRQVRAGYTFLEGPRTRVVRGGAVTNAPFIRPAAFGADAFTGDLGAGWEVELLRGGSLLAVTATDPDGRFRLPAPLAYGPNASELVAYGPGGQERRLSRSFLVTPDRLPAGAFEYLVGGGACLEGDPCAAALLVDARYGVSGRATVRAGIEAFRRDSLADAWHPYVALSVAPLPSLVASLEGTAGVQAAARAVYHPHPALHAEVAHTRWEHSDASPLFGASLYDRQTDASLLWLPRGGPLQLLAAVRDGRGAVPATTVSGGARLRLSGATAGLVARRTSTRLATGRVTAAELEGSLNGLVPRRVPVAGRGLVTALLLAGCGRDLGACAPRARAGRLGLSRRFGLSLNVEAAVAWTGDVEPVFRDTVLVGYADRTVFELTVTTVLPYLRSITRTGYSAQFAYGGAQIFEGSLLWDRRAGRLRFDDGRSVGLAGITGVVFRDLNGDGAQDPGEPGVGDVIVRVGSRAVITDSLGRFQSFELPSFEWAVVELDTLSLRDPTWLPARTAAALRPMPNGFRFVPLPLVEGQELSGVVTLDGRPAGGVTVRAEHEATGRTLTLTTFEDGVFYAPAVRTGRYRLTVPAEVLQRLRAFFAPVSVEVRHAARAPAPVRVELLGR